MASVVPDEDPPPQPADVIAWFTNLTWAQQWTIYRSYQRCPARKKRPEPLLSPQAAKTLQQAAALLGFGPVDPPPAPESPAETKAPAPQPGWVRVNLKHPPWTLTGEGIYAFRVPQLSVPTHPDLCVVKIGRSGHMERRWDDHLQAMDRWRVRPPAEWRDHMLFRMRTSKATDRAEKTIRTTLGFRLGKAKLRVLAGDDPETELRARIRRNDHGSMPKAHLKATQWTAWLTKPGAGDGGIGPSELILMHRDHFERLRDYAASCPLDYDHWTDVLKAARVHKGAPPGDVTVAYGDETLSFVVSQ